MTKRLENPTKPDDVTIRLWRMFTFAPGSCWLANRSVGKRGYAQISDKGNTLVASRLMYLTEVGEIPVGYEVDHLCRERSCLNPLHLEAVPKIVNVLRGIGPSARHAALERCPICGDDYSFRPSGSRACKRCKRRVDSEYYKTVRHEDSERGRRFRAKQREYVDRYCAKLALLKERK